jgi:hypothetical protein
MITGRLRYNNGTLLLIGLTEKNLSQLRAGKPIVLEHCPVLSGDTQGLVLVPGATEDGLIEHLRLAGIGIEKIIDARQSTRTEPLPEWTSEQTMDSTEEATNVG